MDWKSPVDLTSPEMPIPMEARLPENESERLDALRRLDILDTPSEREYDDIVRLASIICETPIALLSFVDEHRQWFKSRLGLAVEQTPRSQAFCAHAILKPSEILVVPDATRDDRFSDNPMVTSAPQIRFYGGVPLVTLTGEALGTLCVIDRKPRSLTQVQETALKALGRQIMALFELRRARRTLIDANAALHSAKRMIDAVIHHASILLFAVDATGKILLEEGSIDTGVDLRQEEIAGKSALDLYGDRPDIVANIKRALAGQSFRATYRFGERIHEVAYVSLKSTTGAADGFIGVASDITDRERYRQRLEEYQKELEAANQTLRDQSRTDLLTQLPNRRAFQQKLDEEIYHNGRYDAPLALMMLDVDRFKNFNDTHGHPAGDETLKLVASILRGSARLNDFPARYGGEEFAILLPHTNDSGAYVLAERVRQAVESAPWPLETVTCSIGVACADGVSDGAALIAAADRALYEAKRTGRNRVCQATTIAVVQAAG